MAVFDAESGKIVVRVVYDGPGRAGKTTNLEQMCTFFSHHRRSELYKGESASDRTLYLDWLQLDGGLVAGRELRCQLVTVPGQVALHRRRQLLLDSADAIIFVLASTARGLEEASPLWQTMSHEARSGRRRVPIVVQANKQDEPEAFRPEEVRARWSIDREIPIVAAEAARGNGVRETVVLAIRAAAIALQAQLLGVDVNSLSGECETGPELEARMREIERARPMSAVDVILAARRGAARAEAPGGSPRAGQKRPTDPWIPARAQPCPSASAQPVRSATPRPEPGRHASPSHPYLLRSTNGRGSPPPSTRIPRLPDAPPPRGDEADEGSAPTLPGTNLPSGCIWPTQEGRRLLRTLGAATWRPLELAAGEAWCRGEHAYQAGPFIARTRRERCFPDLLSARQELIRLAHVQLELDHWRPPQTAFAIQGGANAHWVWTIAPAFETLGWRIARAVRDAAEESLAAHLETFAIVAVKALRWSLDSALSLAIDPRWFAVVCGDALYLCDRADPEPRAERVAHGVLSPCDELSAHAGAVEHYVGVLERELGARLTSEQRQRLGLRRSILRLAPTSEPGRAAQRRLVASLSSRGVVARENAP